METMKQIPDDIFENDEDKEDRKTSEDFVREVFLAHGGHVGTVSNLEACLLTIAEVALEMYRHANRI